MEPGRLWMLLGELAGRLGVEVRVETLEAGEEIQVSGGLCRMPGGWVAFVDKRLPLSARARQLGLALNQMDMEDVHMRPAVREYLAQIAAVEKERVS